jgi:hypothetical protein
MAPGVLEIVLGFTGIIIAIVAENKEHARIVTASIRTARRRASVPSDEN